jgi:hypothetical protein
MEDASRNDIDTLIGEHYIPSALERKKSLMMYMVWGVLLSLSQQKASLYEQFHLKQALGWWTMFFVLIIPSLILFFLPWVKIIPLLIYMALFVVWILFFIQARHGTYTSFSRDKAFLPMFA